jgi:hypothetical protein
MADSNNSTQPPTNVCDSTCVGLAVGLGILFFILGCLLIWYFRDWIRDVDKKGENATKKAEQDLEAGETQSTTNNGKTEVNQFAIVDPAAEVESTQSSAGSISRKTTSNNDKTVELSDVNRAFKRSNNERPIDATDLGPRKKKLTSNNERTIEETDIKNKRASSNNEVIVDPNQITVNGGRTTPSMRGRRTSSNNDRPIDMSDILPPEPEPTPAELEATRKRAESLERRLEEMSKTHSALTEAQRKLQEEIAELSAKNKEMLLDDNRL